jgi:lipopolysaccharide export LptBFGC system permease protein LptF
MFRYVIAVLLTAALVGIALPAINDATAAKSQEKAEAELLKIKHEAESLATHEEVISGGLSGGRRLVTVDLPGESETSQPIDSVNIRPHRDYRLTTISYSVEGQSSETIRIDAMVVGQDNGPIVLTGHQEQTFVLTLKRDFAGNRVVEFRDL